MRTATGWMPVLCPDPPDEGPVWPELAGVQFREQASRRHSAVLMLRWNAVGGPDGRLFAAVDADLTLIAAGGHAVRLRLGGVYWAAPAAPSPGGPCLRWPP